MQLKLLLSEKLPLVGIDCELLGECDWPSDNLINSSRLLSFQRDFQIISAGLGEAAMLLKWPDALLAACCCEVKMSFSGCLNIRRTLWVCVGWGGGVNLAVT